MVSPALLFKVEEADSFVNGPTSSKSFKKEVPLLALSLMTLI
jgi:hypothetical protein